MTIPSTPATPPAGAIYDLGYQHYDGPRLGRAGAVRALIADGFRTLFGVGRGTRAKIPPAALILCTVVPALIQAAIVGLIGPVIQIFRHETYFATTVWVYGLFCAFQTPELVTGDQQYRVLSLYLSRAIHRFDYILARFVALAGSLFLVAIIPHLVLLLGSSFAAVDVVASLKDSLPLVPKIFFASLGVAVLMASASLAIASVLRRRAIATGAILAILLLTSLFAAPMVFVGPPAMRRVVLGSPTLVSDGVTRFIFDTLPLTAVADTMVTYGPIPEPLGPTATKEDSAAYRRAVRARRNRREEMGPVRRANLAGAEYLLAMLGYLVLAGGALTLRYRKIDT